MSETIKIHREGGVTNCQAIVDHVSVHPRGTLFTFEELAEVLNRGSGKSYRNSEVTQIALKANSILGPEYKMLLKNQRGVGYYLAAPEEHEDFADDRMKRSINSEKKSVSAMVHTPIDELSPSGRTTHIQKTAIYTQMHMEKKRQFRKLKRREKLLSPSVPDKSAIA